LANVGGLIHHLIEQAGGTMPKQPARTKTGKARTAKPLPWVPIDEHLKLKEKQTGSMPFAVTDLEKELETGKRRSERRDIRGRREPLSPKFWRGHLIDISVGRATIYRCEPDGKVDPQRFAVFAHHHDDLVGGGHVYFVSADPAAPPVRKSGASGRPRSFASKQIGELQREQRRYEKEHPKPLKKDVEGHLQNWAKAKGITASLGTIRKHMATTKNKN